MREQKIAVKKEQLLGYKLTQLKLYDEEKYNMLSEKTGYSKRSFFRYEKGECGINKTCVEGMARVYGVTYEDFLKFLTEEDFSIEKLFKLPTAEKEQSDPALSENGANKMKKLKIGLSVTVAAAVSSACALIVLCVAFYRHLEGNAAAGANVNFSHWFLLFVIAVLIAAAPAACVFGAWIIKEKIKNKKDKR